MTKLIAKTKEYVEVLDYVACHINEYLDIDDYDDALDNIGWICDNAPYIREMIKEVKNGKINTGGF